jgi:hypothetical protein
MTESGTVATSREGTAGIGDAKTAHLFTSEWVTEVHPDKIADQISDAISPDQLATWPKPSTARPWI